MREQLADPDDVTPGLLVALAKSSTPLTFRNRHATTVVSKVNAAAPASAASAASRHARSVHQYWEADAATASAPGPAPASRSDDSRSEASESFVMSTGDLSIITAFEAGVYYSPPGMPVNNDEGHSDDDRVNDNSVPHPTHPALSLSLPMASN